MNILREELKRIKTKVDFYLGLGRFQAAEKLLMQTLAERGPLANMHNLLGLIFHRQSRFPEAIGQFKRAEELNPSYQEATLNRVATLCDLGCYEQAQEIHARLGAQQSAEALPRPRLWLGRLADRHAASGKLYRDLGLFEAAIKEYRRALSLFARLPEVKLALARSYLDLGELELAEKELEELIEQAPQLAGGHVWLGLVYYRMGKNSDAKRHWEKAHQNSPQDPLAKAYLAVATDWPSDRPLPPPASL